MQIATITLIAQVEGQPDPGGLPGLSVLQRLVNGGLAAAMLLILLAVIAAGVGIAIGRRTNNGHMAFASKEFLGSAVVGAIVVGGAVAIANFFIRLGGTIS